jgi:periplasmic protein TonB
MSQSTLALNEPLSPPRIGGIAAALAVHVAALMMLMAPMTYAPPLPVVEEFTVIPEDVKKPEPPIPPAPPLVHVIKNPNIATIQKPVEITQEVVPPIVIENGETNDTPFVPPQTETVGEIFSPPSGPISLSTEYAPAPRYPALSIRNGEHGTVLLLVKVDATGKPIEVSLKKSSGYRELDRNAMKHVLATWRFHPAMHQGIAIPALALVPVNYTLNE